MVSFMKVFVFLLMAITEGELTKDGEAISGFHA